MYIKNQKNRVFVVTFLLGLSWSYKSFCSNPQIPFFNHTNVSGINSFRDDEGMQTPCDVLGLVDSTSGNYWVPIELSQERLNNLHARLLTLERDTEKYIERRFDDAGCFSAHIHQQARQITDLKTKVHLLEEKVKSLDNAIGQDVQQFRNGQKCMKIAMTVSVICTLFCAGSTIFVMQDRFSESTKPTK